MRSVRHNARSRHLDKPRPGYLAAIAQLYQSQADVEVLRRQLRLAIRDGDKPEARRLTRQLAEREAQS